MEEKDLIIKVAKLEAKVEVLEKDKQDFNSRIDKIEQNINDKLEKITNKIDEKFVKIGNDLEKINSFLTLSKGGWKAIIVIGSLVLGVVSVLKFGIDLLKFKI